ncbi:MAG: LVIVD repeat-containing protein, partial [Gemmatimonadales bacterium]
MKVHALLALVALPFAACATSSGSRSAPASPSRPASRADARIGLRPGWMDAGEAVWNLRVVSRTPPSEEFINRSTPGDFRFINSDISFAGPYVIQGNFSGVQVWDISNPARPTLKRAFVCPGSQSDVSVFRNLLFVSGEALNGRTDCGTQGVSDSVSHDRLRGIRIFDITDIANPQLLTNVQTCRGSHTHTVVTDPDDPANVYIYVSGSAPVRSPNELAGCSAAPLDEDPKSALFRIEVIQVPLAAPAQAKIVSSPRIFEGLEAPPEHGEMPEDIAAAARRAAEARARGAFTAKVGQMEFVLGPNFIDPMLDSIVQARQGTGAPTGADSATLREALPAIVERLVGGPRTGPTQCHDITVYPAIGLAGGACGGYGLLLDIRDVANPRRVAAVADSNFSFWHSATFNNDGTKLLFTDEWGGGLQARCRPTDK